MPAIMTVREATIAVAPAVPAAANAAKPTAREDKPAPAARRPAPTARTPTPIARTPTPNKLKAPANPKMAGTRGVRTAPATPITVNAPAIVTSPLAIDTQLIAPRTLRIGVRIASAVAATTIAAEPDKVPFITFRPIANSVKAPPITVKPLPICSHEKFPSLLITSVMISRAAATTTSPVPIPTIFLGISFVATATSKSAPPIALKPFPICSQFIAPKSATAEANIFIAAPIAANATPVETTCFAFPVRLVNIVISVSNTPTLARPFPISVHDIAPKSLHADANIFMDAARITIPVAVVIAFPLNFAILRNTATSASNTPTPVNPLPSSDQFKLDRSLQTDAKILIAAENITRLVAPLTNCPLPLDIIFAEATTIADKPAIPTSPLAIPSQSRSEIFFIAPARIATAAAIAIMAVQAFVTFPVEPLILLKIAIEPSKLANKTVIAPSEADSFLLSIKEIATIAAAKIAIAEAILRRVPAFN